MDGEFSPAPVSSAAGPGCPVHGVCSASVSLESARRPDGGSVLTGSPDAQSSPAAVSAPPQSPLQGLQPQPPVPLEDRPGAEVSVAAPSSSAHGPSSQGELHRHWPNHLPKSYSEDTVTSPNLQMRKIEAERVEKQGLNSGIPAPGCTYPFY
jgi:hypothetical protein